MDDEAFQRVKDVLKEPHLIHEIDDPEEYFRLGEIEAMLTGMFESLSRLDLDPEDFIDLLMKTCEVKNIKIGDGRTRLMALLSLDNSYTLPVRAKGLRLDRPNTLCSANIFTDIRPVFSEDKSKLLATTPIHSLVLRVHRRREHGSLGLAEHYISLVREDIEALRDVCEKALRKEATLGAFITKSGTSWIVDEEVE